MGKFRKAEPTELPSSAKSAAGAGEEPAPAPAGLPAAIRMALDVTVPCALGYGNRKPGDRLALIHLMPGVSPDEVANAFLNPGRVRVLTIR